MYEDKPKFDLSYDEEDPAFAYLTVGNNSIRIPCHLAGDIATAFDQLWLDWHSPEILEREAESQRQVDRLFDRDEIPF